MDSALATSGKSVVRYDYKGIEGLHLGVDYRFAEERDGNNEVKAPYTKPNGDDVYPIKNGYGVGAVYTFGDATVAAGYTRDNYKSETNAKHHKDAWALGGKYKIDALTLAADYTGSFEKDDGGKTRLNAFRVGAKYQVTDKVAVYGNYAYGVEKSKSDSMTTEEVVYNKFMLGSEYQIHKSVFTYVEGGLFKTKTTKYGAPSNTVKKETEKNIGVGLRVYW
ncbi:hypothetical protein A4G19_14040 [Pasteurellaceae bacterium Macca]|nr:hypothetical protein [Pasteurellaceae bacterium Macca]